MPGQQGSGGSSRFGPWDPFGLWQSVASTLGGVLPPGLAAAASPGTVDPLRVLLGLARSRLVGRRVTWPTGRGEVAFTLRSVDSDLDSFGLASGSTATVTLDVTDVTWEDHAVPVAQVTLSNVHSRLRPSGGEVVAAPVDLRVTVPEASLAEALASRWPALALELGADLVPRVRWARHPGWGSVAVVAEVEGHRVWLRARQLELGSRRRLGARRLPPVWFRVRGLPETLRLVRCAPVAGGLEVHARLDAWRYPLPTGPWPPPGLGAR
jgi:hypothetical protein